MTNPTPVQGLGRVVFNVMPRGSIPNPRPSPADAGVHPGTDGFVALQVISRRYHFHLPGVVYVVTTMIVVVGAVNGQNNLLFWLFGLAVGGLLVSGIISGASLMGLALERSVPLRGRVGEGCEIRYRCRNRNRLFPAFALSIEELAVPFRSTGLPTWADKVQGAASFCPGVRAGESRTCVAHAQGTVRGEAVFAAVRVSSTFPFGITRKSVVFAAPQRTIIWPKAISTTLPAGASGGTGDEAASTVRHRGSGDIVGLREYAAGDSARLIAWRPTSRLGRPIVRETAPPRSRRLWLVSDVTSGLAAAHTEAIVSTVAGLAEDAARRGVSIGLATAGGSILVPIGSGPHHEREVLDALAVVQAESSAGAPQAILPEAQSLLVTSSPAVGRQSHLLVPPPAQPALPSASRNRWGLREGLQAVWTTWLSPRAAEVDKPPTDRGRA